MKTKSQKIELLEKLCRYAEDRSGFPDGDTARGKVKDLINKNPELVEHPSVIALAKNDLGFILPEPTVYSPFDGSEVTTEEALNFKNMGGNLAGSWTGADLSEALKMMMNDYRNRIERAERNAFLYGRPLTHEDIEVDGGIRYWQAKMGGSNDS